MPVVRDGGGPVRVGARCRVSAMLRYWHRRFGGELVAIDTNTEFAVTRPPQTRADALEFARRYVADNKALSRLSSADLHNAQHERWSPRLRRRSADPTHSRSQ